MVVEFWVVRVLLHARTRRPAKLRQMDLLDQFTAVKGLHDGTFGQLPDGSIFEPLESWTAPATEPASLQSAQDSAHERQQQLARDNPTHDYRVIMNADGV